MVQLVDSFNLATDIELLGGLVQVLDGRVLGVTTENQLTLLSPEIGEKKEDVSQTEARNIDLSILKIFVCNAFGPDSLIGTVDVINGQNGQVAVITEVTQSDPSTRLELVLVDHLLANIEGNGHGEDIAIRKTAVLTNARDNALVFDFCLGGGFCPLCGIAVL